MQERQEDNGQLHLEQAQIKKSNGEKTFKIIF